MAYFYLRVDGIKASSSASLIGGAAYIAGQRLGDVSKIYDFKDKQGVRLSGLVLPQNCPNFDRPSFWAAIEQLRPQIAAMGSATLISRSFKVVLPHELPKEAQNEAILEFANSMAAEGWPIDLGVHEGKDGLNQHYHCDVPNMDVLTLDENGFHLRERQKVKVYANALDANGKPIFDPNKPSYDPKTKENADCRIPVLDKDGNQKFRERPGKGREMQWHRVYADQNAQDNSKARLDHWRKLWEQACNKQLQKYGLEQINSKSKDQQFRDGELAVPLKSKCHLGRKASALHRKGINTRRHLFNQKVDEYNKKLLNDYKKKIVPHNINLSDQVFLLICDDPFLRSLWFKMNHSQKGMFAEATYTISRTSYNAIVGIANSLLKKQEVKINMQPNKTQGTQEGENSMLEDYFGKQNYDMVMKAVSEHGRDLQYVKKEFVDKELCQAAFDNDIYAFQFIPAEFQTKEMVEKVWENLKESYYCINDKYKTVAMAKEALVLDKENRKYTPKEILDLINIEKLKNMDDESKLKHFKNEDLTYNLCIEAVKNDYRELIYVPSNIIDQEMCDIAFKQDVWAIENIPPKFQNQDMCDKAFNQSVKLYPNFVDKFKRREWAESAVKEDGKFYKFVPDNQRNDNIRILALYQDPNALKFMEKNISQDVKNAYCISQFVKINNSFSPEQSINYRNPSDRKYSLNISGTPTRPELSIHESDENGSFGKSIPGTVIAKTDKMTAKHMTIESLTRQINDILDNQRQKEQAKNSVKRGYHR